MNTERQRQRQYVKALSEYDAARAELKQVKDIIKNLEVVRSELQKKFRSARATALELQLLFYEIEWAETSGSTDEQG